MLFHPSSTGTAGPSHQSPLAPAEGLDRKPAIALTVINLGLLSSDAHGNSFTAGVGKSLSPAAFDAAFAGSVKAFANCCSRVNKGHFFTPISCNRSSASSAALGLSTAIALVRRSRRRGGGVELAGRVCQVHRRKCRQMDEGDQVRGHQAAVIPGRVPTFHDVSFREMHQRGSGIGARPE